MIVAPLTVMVGKKVIPINLNHYRNGYFHQLNQAKIAYKELLHNQLEGLILEPPVSITYLYYPPDKRIRDLSNVLSIHSKYFEDALVELGYLPDDNYNYINQIMYLFGSIDKENPRVEITIRDDNVI